jgi:putative membrane protein
MNKLSISLFFKGIAIGVAAIIPGVSGGTIAVMFGIYDSIIFSINRLKSHFLESLTYLLPLALGAALGIVGLSFPLAFLLDQFPIPTISLFAGLILGSIPKLSQTFSLDLLKRNLPLFSVAILLAVSLGVFSVIGQLDATVIVESDNLLPKLILLVVGFFGVFAFIVPGISGSMLLLSIGFYVPILNSLRTLIDELPFAISSLIDISNFFLLGVGAIIGFLIISQLMAYLLKNYRELVYITIVGFLIGSVFSIYVNHETIEFYASIQLIDYISSGFLLTIGILFSYLINKKYATG